MDLTDLIVPNSVKIIGRNAFNPTNSLRNVTISNGVTDIFGYAFLGCAAVSILVPASVTYIDEGAFTKRPTIYGVAGSRVEAYAKENDLSFSTGSPEPVVDFYIENGVLNRYYGLGGAVTIPANVTEIQAGAFSYARRVTSVTIPNGVTTIGDWDYYK